jgi:dihydrofolate reductase
VQGDLAAAVRELKAAPGGDILTGGVALPTALAGLGLIDAYEFVVHPQIAGRGPRLLDGLTAPIDLELTDRRPLGAGAVAMRYVPRAPSVVD